MVLPVPKNLYIAHSKWKESPQCERKSLIPVLKELIAVVLVTVGGKGHTHTHTHKFVLKVPLPFKTAVLNHG